MQSNKPASIHFWVPNLFEFKGGIQVYLQDVLQALIDDCPNLKLSVFDRLDKSQPQDQFNSKNISFFPSGNLANFLQIPHFSLNVISRAVINRPNLILCSHLNFAPLALWIHRLTGIPYWIFVYGLDAWWIKDQWKIKALHSADKIVSISSYTKNRLIDEHGIPGEKIPLLPVTFDASQFRIGAKPEYLLKRYGLKPEQPIILTVCRLARADRYKGYDQILQALTEIRRHIPDVHYILVGKGNDYDRVETLVTQLNLKQSVTLTGFIPDYELCDHYNLCDVFAMPSKGEGFGIVYLEALASGKPTLGGNKDGAIDALCHGELGALVDPDNVDAIAQALIQILQGNYPHPIMYQPEVLREKVIDIFGFDRFKQTLAELL